VTGELCIQATLTFGIQLTNSQKATPINDIISQVYKQLEYLHSKYNLTLDQVILEKLTQMKMFKPIVVIQPPVLIQS
jgi:hypothetical protein